MPSCTTSYCECDDPKKSVGADKIGPMVYINILLCHYCLSLYSMFLRYVIIPCSWKLHNIIRMYSKWSGCKKRCGPVQNGQCEKSCEKRGSQEMAVMVVYTPVG